MLPLMKFGVLAMRQLSKPIANAIKRRCLSNPRFRAGCISFAQWWHRLEVNWSIRLLGHEAKVITPLSEEKAVAQGAEVLGEGVIFSIAAVLLCLETHHSSRKEEAKRQKLDATFAENRERIRKLEEAFELLHRDTLCLMRLAPASFSREAIEQREMVEQQRKQALDHLKQHSVLLPPPPSSVMDFGDIWAEADVDMTFYFILP